MAFNFLLGLHVYGYGLYCQWLQVGYDGPLSRTKILQENLFAILPGNTMVFIHFLAVLGATIRAGIVLDRLEPLLFIDEPAAPEMSSSPGTSDQPL